MQTLHARRFRRNLGVLGLVLAESALLFPMALLRGDSFFERDLLVDWYQRMSVLARCLREQSWPLWDPSLGFGYPLLADPGAQVLYPPTWAALVLPNSLGYTAFVLAHLALGGLGMARLARVLGCGARAAAVAAGVWVASGPVLSTLNLRHHFAGAAWLPWVFLALEGVVRAPGPRRALIAAAAVTAQALAGSPDVCVLTVLLAVPWVLLRLAERPSRVRRTLPALAAAALLVLVLGAVQWLPALEVLSLSPRLAFGNDVREFWSVPPSGLVRVALPIDPRRVPFDPGAWTRLFDGPEEPFLTSLYLGAPVLLLAATALIAGRRRRQALALAVLAVFAAACALGPHAPFYGWLIRALPVLRILRFPSKTFVVVAPLVALLAALGVEAVGRSRVGRPAARGGCVALAVVMTWAVVVGSGVADGAAWLASPVLLVTASAVLLLASHGRLRAEAAAPALGALCLLDLLAAHADLNATTRLDALLHPPPAAQAARDSHGRRVYVYDYHSLRSESQRLLGRKNALWTADPPAGVDARAFAAFARTLYMPVGLAGLFGLENSYDLDLRGLSPHHMDDLAFALRRFEGTPAFERMLRMGAVSTVLSLHRTGLEGLRLERALPSLFPEPILVWRVPGAPPRAWLVGCARIADREKAFAYLAGPVFDPLGEVILPEPAGGPVDDRACGPAGSARVVALHPDRVRVEVEAARAAYLVLADAWDPGWRVAVDGARAPLLRANVGFRGVLLPAGRHAVEWVYRPTGVLVGAAISLASLLTLLATWLVAHALRARATRSRREPAH